jgi:hypothetical protein
MILWTKWQQVFAAWETTAHDGGEKDDIEDLDVIEAVIQSWRDLAVSDAVGVGLTQRQVSIR